MWLRNERYWGEQQDKWQRIERGLKARRGHH